MSSVDTPQIFRKILQSHHMQSAALFLLKHQCHKILAVKRRAKAGHAVLDYIRPVVARRKSVGLFKQRGIAAAQTFSFKFFGCNH